MRAPALLLALLLCSCVTDDDGGSPADVGTEVDGGVECSYCDEGGALTACPSESFGEMCSDGSGPFESCHADPDDIFGASVRGCLPAGTVCDGPGRHPCEQAAQP